MTMFPARTSLVVLTLALSGCGGDSVTQALSNATSMRPLDSVGPAEWETLARRKIFFGHQSVGRDMVAGMRDVLGRNPQIGLRIVQSDDPASVAGPAFIEAALGRNGDPHSKGDAFASALDAGFGDAGGIAMYKYCYVDVLPMTDIEAMFEDYVERIDSLKVQYPALTIVHITIPLKRLREGKREWVNRMLGRSADMELHAKRSRYNELLLAKYGNRDPVFDLAALESTRADGARSAVRYRGRTVYTLADEWTDDGAHLNRAGQRRVAEQLLVFLATIDVDATAALASHAPAGAATRNP